jgi:hypothetical protein
VSFEHYSIFAVTAVLGCTPPPFGHRRPTAPKLPTVAWVNELTRETLVKSA